VPSDWAVVNVDHTQVIGTCFSCHNGTVANVTVSDSVPPQPGHASGIYFDGASGYLKVPHEGTDANPLALKGDMTVEFWVNPESFGGGRVFSFSGDATDDAATHNSLYELYITTGGNV